MPTKESIIGSIIGTAVGDSLGLCCEGMSPARQKKVFGKTIKHRFVFGRGMVSDDTEHVLMTAQALAISRGNAEVFRLDLAKRFKRWLLLLPAGIGRATLIGLLRLWLGVSTHNSGVYSAGNGPSMRSGLIGVCNGGNTTLLKELVRSSTRLTHTDPRAEFGALAIALAAYMASTQECVVPMDYYNRLSSILHREQAEGFLDLMGRTINSVEHIPTQSLAERMGLNKGITGYTNHTVPLVIHCWLRHQADFQTAIAEIIACGGDTDTTAAILGSIVGARVGRQGIPREWISGILEWPCNITWMTHLGTHLSEICNNGVANSSIPIVRVYQLLPRNVFFLAIVLFHGLRRLLPPY